MEPHAQYCPVTYAADLLADRWTLLILREVVAGGATVSTRSSAGCPASPARCSPSGCVTSIGSGSSRPSP